MAVSRADHTPGTLGHLAVSVGDAAGHAGQLLLHSSSLLGSGAEVRGQLWPEGHLEPQGTPSCVSNEPQLLVAPLSWKQQDHFLTQLLWLLQTPLAALCFGPMPLNHMGPGGVTACISC